MYQLRSFLPKSKEVATRYAQVLVVILAFALMVFFSYFFIREAEIRHLRRSVEDMILNTELNIKSNLQEPETLLGGISETIRAMLIVGTDANAIDEYILLMNDFIAAGSDRIMTDAVGFFGYFDIFGGKFLSGAPDREIPGDFDPTNRFWYIAAIEAGGEIGMSPLYTSVFTGQSLLSFSRCIYDQNGKRLGIIGLNLRIDRIRQFATETRFAESGYGFLLDENLDVIAHPAPDFTRIPFRNIYQNILLQGGNISEVNTTDFRGIKSIVSIRRLYNGWYMGVVTPRAKYFQSTFDLAIILSAFGAISAALLIYLLVRVSKARYRADERLQAMFDAVPLCANFWDKDINNIDCNLYAVKMFKLSSKKEYSNRFHELSPEYQPDGKLSSDKAVDLVLKAFREGYCRFEWLHKTLDGELIPCEIELIRIKFQNDFVVAGYTRDLRSEKKMLRTIERRTYLLDTVNSAATILLSSNNAYSFEASLSKSFEVVGRCLDVDRVQIWRSELFDGDVQFVLRYEWLSDFGKNCRSMPVGYLFHGERKQELVDMFMRGEYINMTSSDFADAEANMMMPYEMKSVVSVPMFLEGELWGFFSINDCRNERKFSAEEVNILTSAGLMMSSAVNRHIQAIQMREADERTRIMFDTAPLSVVYWDQNLNLVDCNKEAVKMFELETKEDLIEKFLYLSPEYQPDGTISAEKGFGLVKKALDEGYSRFEWVHVRPSGEPIPVDVICIRVKHKDEFTVIEYIRDLREQKAMIAEMKKAEIAQESSKAKSSFLAKMSHEIRTPMNAILGITEIQLQDESLSHITKEAFERIYNSGDLLLGIINDILDLSKIEAGKLELNTAQYEFASLINDTVQLNVMRFESKPIEFTLNLSEALPMLLFGDELRIKQILNNILSNAFKYTEAGMVTLSILAEPAPSEDDPANITLVFSISDTGIGMTSEQVKLLGSEYARFNMEANRKTEGTGLGMNIAMNLIYMMKGTLSIESTPGMGSTFTVRLPQKCSGTETLGKELAENLQYNNDNKSRIRTVQVMRDYMPYGRVLVVDDVETNLYVARGLLAPYGLSIDAAVSGFEALEKIKAGTVYDIIFMDHMMPRMDGIETTKFIRGLGYGCPIVALTANALAGQAEMFLSNGFDDFISKPIDVRQLNASLNRFIRDKQTPEVLKEAQKQKDRLISSTGNAAPLSSQLAEVFARDAKRAAAVFESVYAHKCRRNDDLSTFVINVHAMKSALANVGQNHLSEIAEKLEKAGRDSNVKYILSELPSFMDMLNSVIDKFETKNEENAADEDRDFLKERLLSIFAACEAYNKKAAKKELNEIKQKSWSPATNELLTEVSGYLLHSDFDEAAKVIDGFVQQLI